MDNLKPKQHYLPATIIGNFSNKTHGNRRERPIWVKRRNSDEPRNDIPENVAVKKHLYTLKDENSNPSFIDDQWKGVEDSIQDAINSLINNRNGKMDAHMWTIIVRYIAQLFIRGFEFNKRFEQRLDNLFGDNVDDIKNAVTVDNTNMARMFELQRLYSPIMYADWNLLHNKSCYSIIQNDIGFVPAMDMSGEFGYAIPLNKRSVLLITKGHRTVKALAPIKYENSKWFATEIKNNDLFEPAILSLNQSLAMHSINEYYGPTYESVNLNDISIEDKPITSVGPDLLYPNNDPQYLMKHEMDFFKLLGIISTPPSNDL